MRTTNEVIYDDNVGGTTAVYTAPEMNDKLGAPNKWYLYAIASQASGTTPTLTVQAEQSVNGRDWANIAGTAEINGISLSTTARTLSSVVSQSNGLGLVRFRIQLGGTNPQCRVALHFTGRDPGS